MGRLPGAKNRLQDPEDLFLAELVAGQARWKKEAAQYKEQEDNAAAKICLEYAEAYRILLNKFSEIEKPENDGSKK